MSKMVHPTQLTSWRGVITFLELANMVVATQLIDWSGIGKMNWSRPSAATMETYKYRHN